MSKGLLYVVATPIGNLGDITYRAIETLKRVDLIVAEDTRRTQQLLRFYGIQAPMQAMHEHNEEERSGQLLHRLISGESLALVSDAGTPLISDPGFPLVRLALQQNIRVTPIPGPSALICALSASGLPTDHFLFAGFPPRNSAKRLTWLQKFLYETATLLFYEASHRIIPALSDMAEVYGEEREAVVARELTKLHETFLSGTIGQILEQVTLDPDQQRGEFVILIQGFSGEVDKSIAVSAEKILEVLSTELSVKQAAALTAKMTGQKKNQLYQAILRKKQKKDVI